ncbi:hypothetical protein [Natrinema sp. 74]|uniref:hypothetical protein n=1 Tax=Natrinema sp. 74 TaxID=3384159 RepID=UPI0038D419A3
MLSQFREYLGKMYNPEPQALKVIVFSSAFILFLFATDPTFGNPYYILGLLLTVLTLVSAVALLVIE